MFEHYKPDADVEAVRESRALPTPEFAAENKEMRDALVASLNTMSEQDLIELQSALYDYSRKAKAEKEETLRDYLETSTSLREDAVAKITNLIQGTNALPSSTEILLEKGDRALSAAARLEAVRDITGAVLQERAKHFPNRAA